MPSIERVRAWADGIAEPHPDDQATLDDCQASDQPMWQAAGATRVAAGHLAEFRFHAALAASTTAVELLGDPADDDAAKVACWAWHVRAEALDELGDHTSAGAAAETSAALAEAHGLELAWARALERRIWIARQQGDGVAAAAFLRQLAGRLSPRSHLLCAALGNTLSWLGRLDSALIYAQRCLALPGGQGHRARAHRDLARVLTRLGRFDEARHHLELMAADLAKRPPTLAGTFMLRYAEYHLALASGDDATAERIAVEAIASVADPTNPRRHLSQLSLGRVRAKQGRIDAMWEALAGIDVDRLGAGHRALALRLEAAAATHTADWRRAARALGQARDLLATRYAATPAVLMIEADLAVADPFAADLMPGGGDGAISEFNRALATRDQLLMAAAKDLRGPIGVFELGAELLADPDVDGARVAGLVERGLAEMELLISQLRDTELGADAGSRPGREGDGVATRPLAEVLAAAAAHVAPIAADRNVTVDIDPEGTDPNARVGTALAPVVTSVLALAVRGARRGSTVTVTARRGAPIEIELVAGDGAPVGWTALDSITAATAGGPTAWRLAANQLGQAGGSLTAEWVHRRHVRVRIALGA